MAGQDLFSFSRSFDFHQRGDSNFRWAATSFPIIPARVSAEERHECWVARATLEALNAYAVTLSGIKQGNDDQAFGGLQKALVVIRLTLSWVLVIQIQKLTKESFTVGTTQRLNVFDGS